MKTLISVINETMFNSFMESLDDEIINESMQCGILLQLAKQLKPFGKKNGGNNYWTNKSFSGIFGQLGVEWDKIKDSDFEKYKAGDKAGIKKARAVLAHGDKFINAIILFPNEDGETFDSMICWRGAVNFKEKRWSYELQDYKERPSNNFGEMKQKWIKEDCEERDFYILELKDFDNYKKQSDRREAKKDSFTPGDIYYYNEVAKQNIERYKKIIAKRKAEKAAKEDDTAQRVEEIVQKAFKLSTKAAGDPDKYVDAQYLITGLIRDIYEIKRSDGKGGTYGNNGLLYLFNEYLSNHLSMAKDGGHNYQRESQAKYKEAIIKTIEKLEKRITDIEEKINN